MNDWFHGLLLVLFQILAGKRDAKIRFLQAQVEILRRKIPGNRVVLQPADRKRLLDLGAEVGHDEVRDVLEIVSCKTYRQWLLTQQRGDAPKAAGRPVLTQEIRDAVLRLAKENMPWGFLRIVGELKKLGMVVSRSSVRRLLKTDGLSPEPHPWRRRNRQHDPDSTWQNFLKLHLNSIVACDFLCQSIFTPFGKKTAFVLMFIHLESRKTFVSPATYSPTRDWMCQQARNVGMWLDENGIEQRFILHDRGIQFDEAFDAVFKSRGVTAVKTPIAAPNANSFAESWISRLRIECLNYFLCFGLRHLDFIVSNYVAFHNDHRPHQSKDNQLLRFPGQFQSPDPPKTGPVECRRLLGGLLKSYYRKSA